MRSYANSNNRLSERYDDWLKAMHYRPHTRACYGRTIRMFVEFLGNKSIVSVTHWEIRKFMTRVSEEGATWHTTYRHLGTLRHFYDFLNLGGVVSYVAPRLVKLRAPPRNLPPILSEIKIKQLFAAARTLREKALLEVFYGTGCRLREVARLRIEEIDLAARTARVLGKFRKVRTVLLTETAVGALTTYIGNRKKGFIFREDRPNPEGSLVVMDRKWIAIWRVYRRGQSKGIKRSKTLGSIDSVPPEEARRKFDNLVKRFNLIRPQWNRPLSNTGIRLILEKIGTRAGIKNVGPHMLRRSFATHLYDHGAPPEVIQALLGHVYLLTTMRYTRLSTGRLIKTFEQCHPRNQMHG